MNKLFTYLTLFSVVVIVTAATYARSGQAPEGLTASTASFERAFDNRKTTVTIAPESADIQVLFDTGSATNDTITVWAGDVLNHSPRYGVGYFKVIRPVATKVWTKWD